MFNPQKHSAILFDLGAVLLNIDYHLTSKAFENLGIKQFDLYFSRSIQKPLFDNYEKGLMDELTFCEGIRVGSGLNLSNQQIINAWNAMLLDFPETRIKMLYELAKKFDLYLLSNTNYTHIMYYENYLQSKFGFKNLSHLFKKEYYSYKIGMRKPDKEIFEWVLNENNLIPESVFYLDDSIQHIEGAKKTGIDAYWLNPEKETVEELFK